MHTQKTQIDLVFSHPDFLVINKPCDLSFHDEEKQMGFFNLAKSYFKIKAWPVHRIDKITSGLVIIAKSADAAKVFGQLFESNNINKCYLAISDKKPKKKQGKIIGNMKKSRNGNWILSKEKSSPAITQFNSFSLLPKIRLYIIKPKTGKTHQIRVALKSLGAPILGDDRYGGNDSDRAYLHAYSLNFIWKGEKINIESSPNAGKYFLMPETIEIIKSL